VVPFPYPNRGTIRQTTGVSAVFGMQATGRAAGYAADLLRRAQRLADEQALLNLQNAYGYYLDRGLWQQLADLFAPDGSREVGQAGVYVGRERIRESMTLTGPPGLREGQLNDHLQFEPIIEVAPDGKTAKGRIFELAFVGGGGQPGRIVQNVEENEYVRRDGVWKIQIAHHYTILSADYALGWGKSASPPRAVSTTLPPDRPPTVVYEAYPKFFTPPLHFDHPSAGKPDRQASTSGRAPTDQQLAAALRQVQRVMDYNEIENLQSAYGYYAEKSQWSDIAALFTHDGVLQIDDVQRAGRDRILDLLRASGPEGPVKGALNSQLQLQPVIHVAADGQTARMRSRLLQLTRDAQGRPMWGAGIYENELVKEDGTWKFRRLHLYRTYLVDYKGGWATPSADAGQLFPSRFTPPMHYRNPVSGR
jgi:hypothetical protein